jgi:hypothetical protein
VGPLPPNHRPPNDRPKARTFRTPQAERWFAGTAMAGNRPTPLAGRESRVSAGGG